MFSKIYHVSLFFIFWTTFPWCSSAGCSIDRNVLLHRIEQLGSQRTPENRVSVQLAIDPLEIFVQSRYQNVSLSMEIKLVWTDARYIVKYCG